MPQLQLLEMALATRGEASLLLLLLFFRETGFYFILHFSQWVLRNPRNLHLLRLIFMFPFYILLVFSCIMLGSPHGSWEGNFLLLPLAGQQHYNCFSIIETLHRILFKHQLPKQNGLLFGIPTLLLLGQKRRNQEKLDPQAEARKSLMPLQVLAGGNVSILGVPAPQRQGSGLAGPRLTHSHTPLGLHCAWERD